MWKGIFCKGVIIQSGSIKQEEGKNMSKEAEKVKKEKIPKNVVRCMFCNEPLKLDTLGCIFPKKGGGVGMCCKELFCAIHFVDYMGDDLK